MSNTFKISQSNSTILEKREIVTLHAYEMRNGNAVSNIEH